MSEARWCVACGARLSRYNQARTCSDCVAKGQVAPSWIWDSRELRRALANVELGSALALIRSATGLSQLEFASVLGWGQSAVARAAAGQRDTLYDIRRLLDVADTLGMPRAALWLIIIGNGDQVVEGGGQTGMPLNRREFSNTLTGLAASLGLEQMRVPAKVDIAHVRYLRASVEELWAKDQLIGGGTLTLDGMRLYRNAKLVLCESNYKDDTARGLLGAAGEIAVCTGWLFRDFGDPTTAYSFFAEARLLADQAEDNQLVIRALLHMSHLMVQSSRLTGRPGYARQAVILSQRAVELARSEPAPQLHAILAARQAVAHAAAGDKSSFKIAMARAWRETDNGSPDDVSNTWLRFVTRSEILTHDACGRWYLGDPVSAAEIFRSSLEASLSPRNENNYRALLASTLSDEGDISGAVEEGLVVLSALEVGKINSPRTTMHLRNVRQAAADQPSHADFCERFDNMLKVTSS